MFEKELSFFIENQSKLVQQYEDKYLLIKDEKVVDVYDEALEAYLEGGKKYEAGSFMIQKCIAGADAYTVSISSVGTLSI